MNNLSATKEIQAVSFNSLESMIIETYSKGRKLAIQYKAAQDDLVKIKSDSSSLIDRLRSETGEDSTCTALELSEKYPILRPHIQGSIGLVEFHSRRFELLSLEYESKVTEVQQLLSEWNHRRAGTDGKNEIVRQLMAYRIWKWCSSIHTS